MKLADQARHFMEEKGTEADQAVLVGLRMGRHPGSQRTDGETGTWGRSLP